MTDFASLGMRIDSTEVKTGVSELDKLTAAGTKAEGSVDKLGTSAQQAGAAMATTGKSAAEMAKAAQDVAATWGRADQAITSLANASATAKAEIAGSKAALAAGTIGQAEYEKQILQTKAALGALEAQHRSAVGEYTRAKIAQEQLTRGGAGVIVSAGQQRAAMQQLSFQIGDVASSLATGGNVMTVFAQQSGQVIQALTLMKGEATGLLGFLGGPWGAVVMGAATVAGMFAMKMLDAEDATKKVEFASYALKDAQGILSSVFDMTTGKINTQSGALLALAQAQLLVARVQAQARQAEARSQIVGMQDAHLTIGGGLGGGVSASYQQRPTAGVSQRVLDGTNTAKQGLDQLENLRKVGRITAQEFTEGAAAIANYGVETENLTVLGKGVASMLDGKLDPALIKTTKAHKAAKEHTDKHAEALARDSRAIEAQIAGLYKLADAYLEGDTAALKAEISAKAIAEGIKKQADVEAYVAQQIRLAVAERVSGAAKTVAGLRQQSDAQQLVNNQVAQGLMTSEEASRYLRDEAQLRPLAAAQAIAEGTAKAKLTTIIGALRAEQKRSNDEAIRAKDISGAQQQSVQTAILQRQIGLTGELGAKQMLAIQGLRGEPLAQALAEINVERQKSEVTIRAESDAAQALKDGLTGTAAAIMAQAEAERNMIDLKGNFDAGTDALTKLKEAAEGLNFADAFGAGGAAIDGMRKSLQDLSDTQARYNSLSPADKEKASATYKQAQLNSTIGLISASKRLFSEQSAGYKIMEAAEKAATAVALVRTAIHVAQGAAKIFASLGPFGFPVVAAMVAAMASLGFKGGGGSMTAPPTADDIQKATGTGTVLGDPTAKSNSIANSLAIVADNTNKDIEYSNSMLVALRSIDSGISKLSGSVAKQIQVAGGMFDTTGANLGQSGSAGFLGLFSSSTTRELWDLGLQLNSGSVAQILQNGVTGQTYQIIQQIKKSSGFLGIGGGTKTTYQTTTGQIDPTITDAINGVIYSLRQGLLEGAKVIGLDGAAALIDNFRIEIGQLSFKDMTGDEIEKQLNAVFSKVGDQMAGAILPTLSGMQKIGEGLFETFMRVAREYQVVDVSLKSIGKTFGATGVASLGARDALVQMFESLDAFVSQTDFYRQNFLTDAERIAPVISSVADEMIRLGLASVDSLDGFKAVVNGLDLTTTAGQQTYAALMAVAPAFSSVIKYQDKLAKSYDDQATSLRAYLSDLLGKGSASSLAAAAATFRGTAAGALAGDLDALGALKGVSSNFLDAAKQNAKSPLDYARARAEVLRTVSQAATVADIEAEIQRKQLAVAEGMAADVTAMRAEQAQINASMANSLAALNNKLATVTDGDALKVTSGDDQTFSVDIAA